MSDEIGGDLLPSNATAAERALADVEGVSLLPMPAEVIATLWDPATCPAHLLPYLAWALSVDVWNPAWSEVTKRAVIASSPAVHRRKGTRAAVEDAVAALGLQARFSEWWEVTPNRRRGTFQVMVLAHDAPERGPVVTAELQRDVVAMVRAAKPKSRVAEVGVGVAMAGDLGCAAAAAAVAIHVPFTSGPIRRSLGMAMSAACCGIVRFHGVPA